MDLKSISNLRDKIVLVSMLVFGVLAFVLSALGNPMQEVIMAIIAGLFGVYKGNPSPPTENRTTETTIKA